MGMLGSSWDDKRERLLENDGSMMFPSIRAERREERESMLDSMLEDGWDMDDISQSDIDNKISERGEDMGFKFFGLEKLFSKKEEPEAKYVTEPKDIPVKDIKETRRLKKNKRLEDYRKSKK